MPCVCGQPKLPGRGRRYCAACHALSRERKRQDAARRSREWRAENPERHREVAQIYYVKTQERQRERARLWHHANKERAREAGRRWREANPRAQQALRLRKYGMTLEEYDSRLSDQNGQCAICPRVENGRRSTFDVDHDHATGVVRGLLCNRCNRLLSNAQDDPERLVAAIVYLGRSTE